MKKNLWGFCSSRALQAALRWGTARLSLWATHSRTRSFLASKKAHFLRSISKTPQPEKTPIWYTKVVLIHRFSGS